MLRYLFLFIFFSNLACSEELMVAVASNFIKPMKDLSKRYEEFSNQSITVISGSSAKLMAQIKQGAPYDLFFSADQEKVSQLIEYGLADTASRQKYAKGRLVLWSKACLRQTNMPEQTSYQRLINKEFKYLAIANPTLAPYGRAAVESLKSLGLYNSLKGKLVYGENIAQTFQFVYSANSDLGLVALSQVNEVVLSSKSTDTTDTLRTQAQTKQTQTTHNLTTDNLVTGNLTTGNAQQCDWLVPERLHSPIIQEAVVVKGGNEKEAKKFLSFMMSDDTQQRLLQYGYESF